MYTKSEMTVKQHIIDATEQSGKTLFNRARQVPPEKVEWNPLGEGRSVLAIAQECAECPTWAVGILNHLEYREQDLESDGNPPSTIDACEERFNKHLAELNAAILGFPEDRMSEHVTIPWGTFTFVEIMDIAHWNCNYHEGQINYIQTLYGDKGY